MENVERPGVPRESVPEPLSRVAARQEPTVEVLMPPGRSELTPVFGTTLPPRGVSGLLRRAAYRIPEHKATHWQLLMLADRVDAWGWRLVPAALAVAALGARWALKRWRR